MIRPDANIQAAIECLRAAKKALIRNDAEAYKIALFNAMECLKSAERSAR